MSNERKTENIVRQLLREQGYYDNENIIVEEQKSDSLKVDKLLQTASKSGQGKGYPEFIIRFVNDPSKIIVVECKASIKNHQSKNKKQYSKYAVDGALLYAEYLKNDFDVIAIAVSGETEREVKISNFLWLKQKETFKDVTDKNFLDPKSLFKVVEKQSQPLKEEELVKKAIEYNEMLHSYSIPEIDRCTVISAILVALQDKGFQNSFTSYDFEDDENIDDLENKPSTYNPNIDLIEALLNACEVVLKKNHISKDKQEIILREYGKIKSNHTFRSFLIQKGRKEERNTVLRDLISDVMESIMPYITNNIYDVLGKFYTQFIRYAGSDSKTGLVLTPAHITDLFCDLAEVNSNDIIFDPCCGTGGFLVSAMNQMVKLSGNDLVKHKNIKSNQLIGIEKRPDMFSHACSNMMMRGDGKSHIHFGDCFSSSLKVSVAKENPTKVFLNPPYDVGVVGQLEFIENAMEVMVANGICVAICQMSTCTDTKKGPSDVRRRLLERHTLEAVLSMPDDLFYPVGVITSILVFKAFTPHPKGKKSFFGYFKDDGFLKVKHQGRIDQKDKWDEIRQEWLSVYQNKESIAGLSVTQEVTADDEWCAEAYMETDYSALSEEDFINTIKDYVAFQFLQGK
ncbi:HsdM family class I SAM-dependent methyltransferase [Psychrobacter glacincola]|uniref:HsdM family class I SAM-dependent methyltransferase n=1 Tax=Psychrobacter TaxID=497 RepID=UPI00191AC75F|nr:MULTISPECIES: N-6 DNA methylase [Psychrobacter]